MSGIYDKIIGVIFLAIVQGLTEWLPISSSGHLVIAQEWLGLELPLTAPAFHVILHIGTLCAIITVFREDIIKIVRAIIKLDFEADDGRLGLFITVGSVPTALIAFTAMFFHDLFGFLFYNVLAVGIALFFVTGFFLYISERRKGKKKLSYLDCLLVGIAQGVSIVPGISRSGLTIATGLLRKVEKEAVFKYSFLLSIPAIIGATIAESWGLAIDISDVIAIFFGVVTSFIVGYISLKMLQRIVMKERFHFFAYYCWFIGGLIVLSHFFQ